MEMEDKVSTESGSHGGNSEFDSPPSSENGCAYGGHDSGAAGGGVVPGTVNMGVNINMEKNAAVGGGIIGGDGVMSGGAIDLGSGGGGGGGGGGGSSELMIGKKKRGRPRKYDGDGNIRQGYVRSPPGEAGLTAAQPGFTLSTPPYAYKSAPKRGRGRASGSASSKTLASLGELFLHTAGGDFTPHVVTAHTGEDVAGKILTFAQKGSRGVCVLSANGLVSNVTIRQPSSSGGLLTYEGRFEILTLTGSYTVSDNGGIRSRSGGLSVSLASPDGRIIGGGVAGMLMAAAPIQIVVGSFEANGFKTQKRKQKSEPRATSFQFAPATVTAAIPISQAAPASTICPIPTSQTYVQSRGEADQSLSNKDHLNSTSTDTSDWNDSGPGYDKRPSPDINVSIPVVEH